LHPLRETMEGKAIFGIISVVALILLLILIAHRKSSR